MLVKADGNCFCNFCCPFLNRGVMLAHFHLLGSCPKAKDLLMNAQKDGERTDAHSVLHLLNFKKKYLVNGTELLDLFGDFMHQEKSYPTPEYWKLARNNNAKFNFRLTFTYRVFFSPGRCQSRLCSLNKFSSLLSLLSFFNGWKYHFSQ